MAGARPENHPTGVADTAPAVDRFLDQVVAEELDWRRWVTRYPKSALALAALGGFVLGRVRGNEIVAALGAHAADTLTEGINEFLGRDVV